MFRKYTDWKLVRQLLPVSLLGAFTGSVLLVGINAHIVALIILAFLLYFIYKKLKAIFGKESTQQRTTKHGTTFIGLLSGAIQGTGVSGADLRNGYLYSKGLTVQHIHGTTAWIGMANFAFASVVRIVAGDLTFKMAWPVLAIFPIIVIATYIGRHFALKFPKRLQDYIVLIVMLIALGSLISAFFR